MGMFKILKHFRRNHVRWEQTSEMKKNGVLAIWTKKKEIELEYLTIILSHLKRQQKRPF